MKDPQRVTRGPDYGKRSINSGRKCYHRFSARPLVERLVCRSIVVSGRTHGSTIDFLDRKELELYQIQLWGLGLGYHTSKIDHDERGYESAYQALILVGHSIACLSDLKYSDILGLEKSIDAAYEIASQRLFDVFFDKFKLLDHLLALKHYFLLGYGDFADTLMDALA